MTETPKREFIDTNVFLYAYDREHPKHNAAIELVSRLATERTGAVSVQVLQELFVNATRKIAKPLSVPAARARVESLSRWRVHSPTAADVLAAIDIHRRHRISFWDSMIVRSAAELGCPVLWSEDLNPGQRYGAVRVQNPFV